jgi:hypothetical protein
MVGRHVAVAAIEDATRFVAEDVPAGGAAAILVRRALNLVRGSGDAPDKIRGETPGGSIL